MKTIALLIAATLLSACASTSPEIVESHDSPVTVLQTRQRLTVAPSSPRRAELEAADVRGPFSNQ